MGGNLKEKERLRDSGTGGRKNIKTNVTEIVKCEVVDLIHM
jgi:hypothetical protein